MENVFEFSPLAIAAVPVALGLVSVARGFGLPSKLAPGLSLLVGVVLVFLTGTPWQASIIQGILVGLSASGLWSGSRTTVEAIRG